MTDSIGRAFIPRQQPRRFAAGHSFPDGAGGGQLKYPVQVV